MKKFRLLSSQLQTVKIIPAMFLLLIFYPAYGFNNDKTAPLKSSTGAPGANDVTGPGNPAKTQNFLSFGNPNAPVQIKMYHSYTCRYCELFMPVMERLLQKYPNEIVFLLKHYPRNETDEKAANAVECALDQSKGNEMHEMIYQKGAGGNYTDYAQNLGVNLPQFTECLENSQFREKIIGNYRDGVSLGVKGTPTYEINNHIYLGYRTAETWAKIIEKELAGDQYNLQVATGGSPRFLVYESEWEDLLKNSIITGDSNAELTVILYENYGCSACRKNIIFIKDFMRDDASSIRVVYKHDAVLALDKVIAEALECSAEMGKFTQMQNALLDTTEYNLHKAGVLNIAAQAGADKEAFAECLNSGRYSSKVNADAGMAAKLGVAHRSGFFFINGNAYTGEISTEFLEQFIKLYKSANKKDGARQ